MLASIQSWRHHVQQGSEWKSQQRSAQHSTAQHSTAQHRVNQTSGPVTTWCRVRVWAPWRKRSTLQRVAPEALGGRRQMWYSRTDDRQYVSRLLNYSAARGDIGKPAGWASRLLPRAAGHVLKPSRTPASSRCGPPSSLSLPRSPPAGLPLTSQCATTAATTSTRRARWTPRPPSTSTR